MPTPAKMSVAKNALRIVARRRWIREDLRGLRVDWSTLLLALCIGRNEKLKLQFDRSEIVGVEMFLTPDVIDNSWLHPADLSYVIIKHRDPLDVVPFFESAFVTLKSYWLKAIAKRLKEQLGLKPEITEETKQTRERRLLSMRGQPEVVCTPSNPNFGFRDAPEEK